MSKHDARTQLIEFLERRAFNPVLHASGKDNGELADLKRRTETEIERFRNYGSAHDVVVNFRRDLTSEPAKKIHRRLAAQDLPTLPDLREDFEQLVQRLGVEGKQ